MRCPHLCDFHERGQQRSDFEWSFPTDQYSHRRESLLAKTWQKQVEAFEAIREDLGTSCRAGDPVPELEAGKIGDHRERSRLTVDGPANVVRGERPYDGHAI